MSPGFRPAFSAGLGLDVADEHALGGVVLERLGQVFVEGLDADAQPAAGDLAAARSGSP